MMNRSQVIFGTIVAMVAGIAVAADWPQFRGPEQSGIAEHANPPIRWGLSENIRWTADLPGRGLSSPIVAGNRVILTAASGLNQTRLHVLSFDANTGKLRWERQFWATGQTTCHPKTCMAAPTPLAADGCVFALFATGDLVCLDENGDLQWVRTLTTDYPANSNLVGRASSPIFHDGLVIVLMESHGESLLLGIDAKTGQNRWKTARPREINYSTPLLVTRNGRTDLVVQAQGGLTGYVPSTGIKRWRFDDEKVSAMASPVVAGDLLLGTGAGTVALRITDSATPDVVWRAPKLICNTATPVVTRDRIFAIRDNGVLQCANVADGTEVWSQRVRGEFSSSPVAARDALYLVNENGLTTVMRIGDKPERLAANDLADPMLATPAISGSCLFMRSDRHLYCIGGAAK